MQRKLEDEYLKEKARKNKLYAQGPDRYKKNVDLLTANQYGESETSSPKKAL